MRLIFSYEVTNEELESSVLVLLMLLSLYPVWQIKLASRPLSLLSSALKLLSLIPTFTLQRNTLKNAPCHSSPYRIYIIFR